MAVDPPLNNFMGPEGVTVTVAEQLLNTEYCTAVHAEASYHHGVDGWASRSHAMCTGRDLVAGVACARLQYAKRLVTGVVLGACRDMRVRAVHAYGVSRCCVDTRREPGHQYGCGEAVPGDAGGRPALVGSPVAATQTRVGVGWASAWGARRRGVFPQCGVEPAWALGLVGHLVALSGLLRRSPSRPLRDC